MCVNKEHSFLPIGDLKYDPEVDSRFSSLKTSEER